MSDVTYILSRKWSTQGDNAAMAMYSISVTPLIDKLQETATDKDTYQLWFADDSSVARKLEGMKMWRDSLQIDGPKYEYYPKSSIRSFC